MSISVTNNTPNERTIFLEAQATEYTLGVVRAYASQSFSVPSGLDHSRSSLELEARITSSEIACSVLNRKCGWICIFNTCNWALTVAGAYEAALESL